MVHGHPRLFYQAILAALREHSAMHDCGMDGLAEQESDSTELTGCCEVSSCKDAVRSASYRRHAHMVSEY